MAVLDSILDQAKITFGEGMHVRAQQKQSKLSALTVPVTLKGKYSTYDGVGTLEMTELFGRYQDIVYTDMEFWRRKVVPREFGIAVPVDKNDIEERLMDADGVILNAMEYAYQRQRDRVIIEAMFASVLTGENVSTTVTYANDGGTTVTATSGLTYEKILEMKQNFVDNEVGNEGDVPMYLGITGVEQTDLFSEIELMSGDFSRQYAIDGGEIEKAVGINLIKFAANGASSGALPLLPVAAGVRTSFCMAKGAIAFGTRREYDVQIQEVTSKYHTHQIVVTGVMGAVRTEGKLIQKVTLTA